jgi:hypothetical protein
MARFWPLVAALLLGVIHPVIAVAFAFVMAPCAVTTSGCSPPCS